MKKILIIIFVILIPKIVCAEWSIQTIDSGGHFSSIVTDSNNYPHIAYSSKTYTALKYTKFIGTSWLFQNADNPCRARNISLALDTNNYPHISYQQKDAGYAEIHYSSWTGTGWAWKYVDGYDYNGNCTSIAIGTNGYPYINTIGEHRVRYTNWTGAEWSTVQDIESSSDYSSLALDSNNYPNISYYKVGSSYDLKYSSWTGTLWSIQTIDSVGDVGNYNSIAIDTTTNNIHISYYDTTNGDLKYASWAGTTWSTQTVDSAGNVGLYTSIELDTNNYPHISYYDLTNGNLKYAKWTGTSWSIQTIDYTGTYVGGYASFTIFFGGESGYTSLAIDSNDNPHISYFDVANDKLKYAKWTNFPALTWTNETNYESCGVNPSTTTLKDNSFFIYRIKYTDADNDAPASGYPKLYVKKGGTNIAGSPFIMTADNPADTTYTDGKIYFSSMTLSLGSDYTYYFESYDIWNATATGAPTTAVDSPDVINNNPAFSWTNETNYSDSGLYPVTGSTTTVYTYRVKYADADNDAPASGYPKVHIKKGGVEIVGSPLTMNAVDAGDVTYTDGKFYTYSRTLSSGTDYTYSFETYDIWDATATGTPTTIVDAPNAIYAIDTVYIVPRTSEGVPPENVTQGDTNKAIGAFKLYTDDNTAMWQQLKLKRAGTGQDSDISAVKVWYDCNNDGLFDSTTDQCITDSRTFGQSPDVAGEVTLIISSQTSGQEILKASLLQKTYFVTFDFSSSASTGPSTPGFIIETTNYITLQEQDIVTVFNSIPPLERKIAGSIFTHAPTLSWTNETNYESCGVNPSTTTLKDNSFFIYRIKYSDVDNDAPASGYPKLYVKKGGTNIAGSPFTMTADNPADTTYIDGKIYFSSMTLSLGSDYTYYFESYDIWNTIATGTPTIAIDAPDVVNNSPTISYTNEAGYTSGGVSPEVGTSTNTYIFRVKYADADNDAPFSNYPKLHIKKGGVEISSSPFIMTEVDSNDTTCSDGKLYTYSTILSSGTNYTYYFEAYDIWNESGTGILVSSVDAPDVMFRSPTLSWTSETGYTSGGVSPEVGTSTNTYIFRVKFADADGDAPLTNYPKLHIKKGGVEISSSPFIMTEVDSNDTVYTDGKIYTYSKELSVGTNYSYYFEGYDVWSASATGTATSLIDAPDLLDVTIPVNIVNLTALTNSTLGSALLTWTAPSDDAGAVLSYVLKYSINQISSQDDFNNATTYTQSWTPANPGEAESKTLTNISGGATYYFAIESIDTSSNTSIISNVSSCFVKGTAFDHYEVVVATGISAGSNFALRINAKNSSNDSMPDFSGNVSIQTVLASNEALAGGGVLGVASASLSNGTVIIYNQTYTKAENIKLKVTDSNSKTGTSSAITVLGVADNTSNLSISANPSSIVTGQSSEITATLKDVYDNALNNIYVEFSVVKGSGAISAASVLTNSQGQAKVTFTRNDTNKAEVNTIRATMGTITADVNVNVGIMIYSAAGGTIVASEDPNTTVTIPPNAIGSDVYICIKKLVDIVISIKNKANNATDKEKEKIISDSIREFSAFMNDGSSYSNNFNDYVTVEMPYKDDDNNNIVDGTNISVDDLKVMRLDETKEEWQVVSDGGENKVDKVNKVVEAQVEHFSIYTIGKAISANLDNLKVYPNPVNFSNSVRNTLKFGNLPRNPEITIYNISGRLVKKLEYGTLSNNGTSGKAEWDGKNEEGDQVEMGLYIFIIKDENGDKKTGRIGVVK